MEFKVYDVVYDADGGIGVVVFIYSDRAYPVEVLFEKDRNYATYSYYTYDGRRWLTCAPSLFHASDQDLLYTT